jgi:hypothetical protein
MPDASRLSCRTLSGSRMVEPESPEWADATEVSVIDGAGSARTADSGHRHQAPTSYCCRVRHILTPTPDRVSGAREHKRMLARRWPRSVANRSTESALGVFTEHVGDEVSNQVNGHRSVDAQRQRCPASSTLNLDTVTGRER